MGEPRLRSGEFNSYSQEDSLPCRIMISLDRHHTYTGIIVNAILSSCK